MDLYIADGVYYGTQDEARKAAKRGGTDFRAEAVPTVKAALIEYLNALVTATTVEVAEIIHSGPTDVAAPAPASAPNGAGYALKAVAIEDVWDDLPLATQLHYGALALENARTVLPGLIKAADAESVL